MPTSEQDVVERLRESLELETIAPQSWDQQRRLLERRATSRRLRRSIVASAVGMVAIAGIVAATATRNGGGTARISRPSTAVVTSYSAVATAHLDQQGSAAQFAVGAGSIFVDDWTHGRILRYDARTLKVTGHLAVGHPQSSVLSIAYGDGAVWALDFSSFDLLRIDPTSLTVIGRTPVGAQPSTVAYGDGSVWMTSVGYSTHNRNRQRLARVDPATGHITGSTVIPGEGQSVQLAIGRVVAVSGEVGPIFIVDPTTMKIIHTMRVPSDRPARMTALHGEVYVLGTFAVVRLSTTDGQEPVVVRNRALNADNRLRAVVRSTVSIGSATGALWVETAGKLLRIDPAAGMVTGVAAVSAVGETAAAGVGSPDAVVVSAPNALQLLEPAAH